MSLYDGIKNVAKIVQQADNIELYRQLLDLSAQALDMQAEIARLKEENAELKKKRDIESSIIRYDQTYITLEGDDQKIPYCAVCWGKDHTLIQMRKYISNDGKTHMLSCGICENFCEDTSNEK